MAPAAQVENPINKLSQLNSVLQKTYCTTSNAATQFTRDNDAKNTQMTKTHVTGSLLCFRANSTPHKVEACFEK